VNFDTISDLVERLRLVAPDFAESYLVINATAEYSYVAFTADWRLDDGQLFLLGLNPKA
jgi:hypothetical protein